MMMPAQQGFETDNVAAAKVDLCLIEGDDTIVAQRLARLAQHRLTALRGLAHFGTKFANDPRTLCLRRVKREVCALQYSFGVIAVGRPQIGRASCRERVCQKV